MTLDVSLLELLTVKKTARDAQRFPQQVSGGSGGNEPPQDGGIEQRVRVLEASFYSIDKTLAVIIEQLKHLASRDDVQSLRSNLAAMSEKLDTKASATDLAVVSGKLDTKASATDLAELKGRVARIPTVPVLVSILVLISLLFAAASWTARHLPQTWSRALQ